jgi:hypothetical protein
MPFVEQPRVAVEAVTDRTAATCRLHILARTVTTLTDTAVTG